MIFKRKPIRLFVKIVADSLRNNPDEWRLSSLPDFYINPSRKMEIFISEYWVKISGAPGLTSREIKHIHKAYEDWSALRMCLAYND